MQVAAAIASILNHELLGSGAVIAAPPIAQSGHTVYRCEYVPRRIPSVLFPDYAQQEYGAGAIAGTGDLLLYGWGPCGHAIQECGGTFQTDSPCIARFPGKIIYVNGEEAAYEGRASAVSTRPYSFYLGPVPANSTWGRDTNGRAATHMQVLSGVSFHGLELSEAASEAGIRARQRGRAARRGFVVYACARTTHIQTYGSSPHCAALAVHSYAATNCVAEREAAFDALVNLSRHLGIDPPEAIGKCCGSHPELQRQYHPLTARAEYNHNHKLMRQYRYALVMENTVSSGYVTEKITNAFLGGSA
jgi:hypothetical protein